MDNLLRFIRSLTSFSDSSWALLQPALEQREFNKKDFLLKEGEICRSLFYISSGYCKSYYEKDGVKKNTGFFFENEITTNVNSFGSGQQSAFNIVAAEPMSVVIFKKDELFEIAKRAIEIETLGRCCIRLFATKQEELTTVFQLLSPEERLAYLESNKPELVQRVPLTQLASFLGVARETLSRIRKRRFLPKTL